MKRPNLSIDVAVSNAKYDTEDVNIMDTTYRAEGLSIGRNVLRFQGTEVSSLPSLDQYIVDGTIGRGTSSVVKRARLKNKQDTYYALKVFPLEIEANKDIYDRGNNSKKKHSSMLVQEIKLMCQLECDCLVQMVGAFYEPGVTVTMVLEFMDYGSLAQYMESFCKPDGSNFGEPALASIAYQILFGLSYLHHENILHRDIKPENILINSEGSIKISDLGISGLTASAKMGADSTSSGLNHTVVGTSRFMSPERVLDKAYGLPSDIWSFGLVLIEVATGHNPFCFENVDGDNSFKEKGPRSIIELAMILDDFCIDDMLASISSWQIEQGVRDRFIWKEEVKKSGGIGEVLRWSLQRLPEKRIPANVLLDSPWFITQNIQSVASARRTMHTFINGVSN